MSIERYRTPDNEPSGVRFVWAEHLKRFGGKLSYRIAFPTDMSIIRYTDMNKDRGDDFTVHAAAETRE